MLFVDKDLDAGQLGGTNIPFLEGSPLKKYLHTSDTTFLEGIPSKKTSDTTFLEGILSKKIATYFGHNFFRGDPL